MFDKTLKSFGIKYIKQNLSKYLGTVDNLKEKVVFIQLKKVYMNLLLSKFVSDIVVMHTDCNLKLKKEVL